MRARFLLFVIIVALFPPLLAIFITTDASPAAEQELQSRMTSARSTLLETFASEESEKKELLLKVSLLPEVISLVRDSAGAATPPPADSVARVRAAITDLFRDKTPKLIAVVNQTGAQVVITGGEPKSADVEALAPAGAALAGQVAVTYGKYDGKFYRLTAAPVGLSDAAIVVGDLISDSTANRANKNAQADVTFVIGGKVVLSTSKDQSLLAKLAAARPGGTIRAGELEMPMMPSVFKHIFPIGIRSDEYSSLSAILSPVSNGQVADPAAPVAWVSVKSSLGWTGRWQAYGFIAMGIMLVLGLIWSQLIYGPVKSQARSIEAHLARLNAERSLRLTTKGFTPPFSTIAQMLDKLADEWTKDQPYVPPVIREIPPLSSTGEVSRPVIQRPPVELPLQSSPPPPASAEVAAVAAAFPFADDPRTVTGRQKISPGATTSKEVAKAAPAARSTTPPPPKAAPLLAGPPAKPDATRTTTPRLDPKQVAASIVAPVERDIGGPVPLPGSLSPPARSSPKQTTATAAAMNTISESDIPADLLARSQELEREMLGGGPESDSGQAQSLEEQHYHAIFDEFVATRRRCNEENDGLTYDKFAARLRKNRDQLVEKYKCRTVRFQVYVKDGKAAVKAVPVR